MRFWYVSVCLIGAVGLYYVNDALVADIRPLEPASEVPFSMLLFRIEPLEPSPDMPLFFQEECDADPAICQCAYSLLPFVHGNESRRSMLLEGGMRAVLGMDTEAWAQDRLAAMTSWTDDQFVSEIENLDLGAVFDCLGRFDTQHQGTDGDTDAFVSPGTAEGKF